MVYSTNKRFLSFRVNFSNDSCLVQLKDFVLIDMYKGMHTGMIVIYLQKAFGTLDHKVVFERMTWLGFKTPLIKSFESDLSNRKFFLSVDDAFLEAGKLICGAPSGVCFGTNLYIYISIHIYIYIHINELTQSLSESGSRQRRRCLQN